MSIRLDFLRCELRLIGHKIDDTQGKIIALASYLDGRYAALGPVVDEEYKEELRNELTFLNQLKTQQNRQYKYIEKEIEKILSGSVAEMD